MNNQDNPRNHPFDGLGDRLAQAIVHLGINQSEFARQLSSSPGFVSDVVRNVKKPGAEFLYGVRQVFGLCTNWLLTGSGGMFGGEGLRMDLLRAIRLHVAVARAAVSEGNPTAKALLLLIRDGRMQEITEDPMLRNFLDQLCPDDPDFNLILEIYNAHIDAADPASQYRHMLAAAIAHFEARQPLDNLATLLKYSGATLQINVGVHQRNAGLDYNQG